MSVPILFFPGIMGSRLYFPNSRRYWDPDMVRRMARWAPIRPFRSDDDNRRDLHFLESAGVIVGPVRGHPEGEALGWGGVVWSFYSEYLPLLRELAAGGNAFAVGYDWRQDLRWLGAYAADKVRQALATTGAAKVALVGHSMGGLVARAALRSAPDLVGRVSKVVFVAQPAVGAVILYRRLFTGMVPGLDGGNGVLDRVVRLILGNSRAGFVGNMSGLPGGVSLLPSGSFPVDSAGRRWHEALDGGLPHDELYLNAANPPGLVGPASHPNPEVQADFRARVEEVAEMHRWLGPPVLDPGIEMWQLVGRGLQTEVGIGFSGPTAQPRRTSDGDDTVPSLSARAMTTDPGRTIEFAGLSHATACQQPGVSEATRHIL
jgi:pimeloyl-ACP methyl ester carboxylesterase